MTDSLDNNPFALFTIDESANKLDLSIPPEYEPPICNEIARKNVLGEIQNRQFTTPDESVRRETKASELRRKAVASRLSQSNPPFGSESARSRNIFREGLSALSRVFSHDKRENISRTERAKNTPAFKQRMANLPPLGPKSIQLKNTIERLSRKDQSRSSSKSKIPDGRQTRDGTPENLNRRDYKISKGIPFISSRDLSWKKNSAVRPFKGIEMHMKQASERKENSIVETMNKSSQSSAGGKPLFREPIRRGAITPTLPQDGSACSSKNRRVRSASADVQGSVKRSGSLYQKTLTKPVEFKLHTMERASKRKEFDEYLREREKYLEELRQRRKEALEELEKKEIALLRAESIHRPEPIRHYKPIVIVPNTMPLTVPKSPHFTRRTNKP